MGSSVSTLSVDILKKLLKDMTPDMKDALALEISNKCSEILKEHPSNRCCKYAIEFLGSKEGKELSNEDAQVFFKCICTGIENPNSGLGCYVMTPDDLKKFSGFFDKVIRDYHGDSTGKKVHTTDWEVSDSANYDVKNIGLDDLSMRVRVGRNLVGYNLPGSMDKAERIKFEIDLQPVFERLKNKWGGQVYSLTPDLGADKVNPNLINEDTYINLVENHVMFKDMAADPYLKSAGISNNWPYGRGCWQSKDKTRIVWFGEEDQLRIMCMKKSTNIIEVFKNLKNILDEVESTDGITFVKDDKYGYVTSCPSNLGTGMRASVHVQVPNLTSDGSDLKAKEVCKPLGLSVRGMGGEHTPIGVDGTVDISPSARLFIKESEIIDKLFKGISSLVQIENQMKEQVKASDDIVVETELHTEMNNTKEELIDEKHAHKNKKESQNENTHARDTKHNKELVEKTFERDVSDYAQVYNTKNEVESKEVNSANDNKESVDDKELVEKNLERDISDTSQVEHTNNEVESKEVNDSKEIVGCGTDSVRDTNHETESLSANSKTYDHGNDTTEFEKVTKQVETGKEGPDLEKSTIKVSA